MDFDLDYLWVLYFGIPPVPSPSERRSKQKMIIWPAVLWKFFGYFAAQLSNTTFTAREVLLRRPAVSNLT